jgi:hypothetical protein
MASELSEYQAAHQCKPKHLRRLESPDPGLYTLFICVRCGAEHIQMVPNQPWNQDATKPAHVEGQLGFEDQ